MIGLGSDKNDFYQFSGFKKRNISFNEFLMFRTLLRIIVIIRVLVRQSLNSNALLKNFYQDQSDQDGKGEVDDDVMVILC